MKEWVIDLPGKHLAWSQGATGAFPRTDPGTAHTRVRELLFHLRKPAVLSAARSMHKALTGQRLEGAFSPFEASSQREALLLERSLFSGLTAGRLQVAEVVQPPIAIPLPPEEFLPAALGPTTSEETESVFEVCLLDVAGTALSGVEVTFSSQGKQEKKKTDGSGVARFEGFEGSFGQLAIDPKSLAEVAEPAVGEGRHCGEVQGQGRSAHFERQDRALDAGERATADGGVPAGAGNPELGAAGQDGSVCVRGV